MHIRFMMTHHKSIEFWQGILDVEDLFIFRQHFRTNIEAEFGL